MGYSGVDLLGLGHRKWPIKATIRDIPAGYAIGCFDTTFGNALPALRKLLATGKYPAVRVHLWYSANKSICPVSVIRDRAPRYEKLAKEFPTVKIYLSHSCEHEERNAAIVKKRMDLLHKFAPSTIPVNNPWRKGKRIKDKLNETHDMSLLEVPQPYIVSTDGRDILKMDGGLYLQLHECAEICFVWTARFNLKASAEEKAKEPKKRSNVPDLGVFRAVLKGLR